MKMNSMFKSKNAIGLNYTTDIMIMQDRSLVIDVDNDAEKFTVHRTGLVPFTTDIPENIPAFIAEMICCTESVIMAEFKEFVDAVASAIMH